MNLSWDPPATRGRHQKRRKTAPRHSLRQTRFPPDLERLESKSLLTAVTGFTIPGGNVPTQGIAAGPDGALWFTEPGDNAIGRITTTGSFTLYPLPNGYTQPEEIAAGPDGALWFTEPGSNAIGRITTSGSITEYPLPTPNSSPQGITVGPDGALWFTEEQANQIGRITTSGVVTEYPIADSNSQPLSIATGSDGALWFTESNGNAIGRITTGGVETSYALPNGTPQPLKIVAGSDGALWFTENGAGTIGRISTSGAVTAYPLPGGTSQPQGLTVGSDGALWFTTAGTGTLGRMTTAGSVTSYPLPSSISQPLELATGSDGAFWFTEGGSGGIGRIAPTEVVTEFPISPTNLQFQGITTGPDSGLWFTASGSNSIDEITAAEAIIAYAIPTGGSDPWEIVPGPDGDLWFTEEQGDQIGRITTAGVITEFALPGTDLQPQGIAVGSDGALWFTESNGDAIGRITTAGVITTYALPNGTGEPEEITAAPDGALWFTESSGNTIGRITTAGVYTAYSLPNGTGQPEAIATGPDGALWFTENGGNAIGRITTAGIVTSYAIPNGTGASPAITAGPDGSLWFTEDTGDAFSIDSITTAGVVTEHSIPTGSNSPWGITVGPDDNIWFTENGASQVGELALNLDPPLAASGAAVSSTAGASFSGEVATFTDADTSSTVSDYSATIDWGDGNTSAGVIGFDSTLDVFTVSGTNTYAGTGVYPVTVTIDDVGGGSANEVGWATVVGNPSSVSVVSSLNASAYGDSVTFTATAAAVAPASGTPTGTITFLDGTTVLGTVALSGGTASLTTAALSAGSHPITVQYNGDSQFAPSASATLTQNVDQAVLSVTVNPATKVYGQPNPAFSVTYSGLLASDLGLVLGLTITYSTTATTSSPVGGYSVTPSGLILTNYVIAYVSGTLSITPAPLSVTANNAGRAYGQSDPAFTASYSGFVNGDSAASLGGTLSFSTTATAASPVGSYPLTPGGLSDTNYNITYVSGTLSVSKASLTVRANNATKVYGQPNPAFTVSYSGFANGDSAASLGGTLDLSTTATTASAVGSYPITPTGLTSSNYNITFVGGTLSVTQASLTVTANDATKVYGQSNPAFTVSYNGFVNGDSTASLGGVLSLNTTATASSPAGPYAVTPAGLTSGNYDITFVDGTLTITPASLTITANDATKVYGQSNPTFNVTYSGFVNGDSAASLGGTLGFNTTATASTPVGPFSVTPAGLTSSNYDITFVGGTLSITPASLTITANDATKVYGQPNPAFTVSYSGFVNGDSAASLGGTLGFSTTATTASPIGPYAVTPDGLTSSNYDITFLGGTLTITPASLTITANDATKVYGQSNPAFNVFYSGFVNGDSAASLGGTLAFNTTATASSPAGPYAVMPSGLTSSNYDITFVGGTLSITPASLTITANDATKVYGQPNPAFTVSYSGFVNGDSAASLGGTFAFNTTATTASPTGAYSVTPDGLTSSNYDITFLGGTLSITPAPLTITADDATKVYGQPNPAFNVTYSGFVNGDSAASLGGTLAFNTTATASSPTGPYAVTPDGLTSSNYDITFVGGMLTITPASLTITADDTTKIYGQPNPAFAVSYSGFVNGDSAASLSGTLAFNTTATASSPTGAYSVTPDGLTSSNYDITFVGGTLSITPASLTITANDATKVYGQANPAFNVSYSGFVNGDSPSALGGTLSFSTTATAASPVGFYSTTPAGLTSSNYSISFAGGRITVTKALLTVTADAASKVYGRPNPAFTASYSGFVNGDTPSALGGALSFSTTATAASAAGSYAIRPVGLTSTNYSISFVSGRLTISKAPLIVTAASATRFDGQPNPVFTASISGFVNGDSPSALGGMLRFSTRAGSAIPVGSYAITPAGLTSRNYAITFVNGTLTVDLPPIDELEGNPDSGFSAAGIQTAVAGSLPLVMPQRSMPPVSATTQSSPGTAPPDALNLTGRLIAAALTPLPIAPGSLSGSPPAPEAAAPAPANQGGSEGVAAAAENVREAGVAVEETGNGARIAQQQAVPTGVRPATQADKGPGNDRAKYLREGLLWSAMELFDNSFEEEALPKVVRAVVGVSAIASTGYVLLNSRAVYWLITALTSCPLWKVFDPLEVIFAWEEEQQDEQRKKSYQPHVRTSSDDADDESLQSIVAGSAWSERAYDEVAK